VKLGARSIAILAVTLFLLVPAIFADDTGKFAEAPKHHESMNSTAMPGAGAAPKPAGTKRLASREASSGPTPAGKEAEGHSPRRAGRTGGHDRATPKVELFMGYSYWRDISKGTENRIVAMHGGSTSLAYNLNNHVGLVFDFGGFRDDSLKFNSLGVGFSPSRVVDSGGNVFTFLFGPRISFRNHDRLTPFLQVLGGAARASEVTVNGCTTSFLACQPLLEETDFALTAGGGLDLRLNHRIARAASISGRIPGHAVPGSYLVDRGEWLAEQRAPVRGNRVSFRGECSVATAQPFTGGLVLG